LVGSEHLTTITRLRGLLDVARLARSDASPSTIVERVAATISESLGWQTVAVSVYRSEWDDFRVDVVHGPEAARTALLGKSRTWQVWNTLLDERFERHGAYLVPSGSFDWEAHGWQGYLPDVAPAPEPEAWQPADYLFVPLRDLEGELLGVVSVDEPAGGRRPSDEEIDVLVGVCAHAAHALASARAAAAARRYRLSLQQLLEVSSKLARGEAVLDTVCQGIRDALGFDRVALFLVDEAADRYRPAAVAGWAADDPGLDFTATIAEARSLYDPAFEIEGCYLLSREAAHARVPEERRSSFTSRIVGSGKHGWTGQWLLVPILDGNGFIWVDDPRDRLLPSRDRMQALRLFANQATAALETAEHVQALRASEARKSAILESALDCVITIDHAGRIVEFNPEAEETFGWTSDEALGRELAELLVAPGRDRRRLADYFATGMAAIVGKRLEFSAIRANGKEFPVEVGVSKVRLAGPPLYTATLRDISKRRRAEDRLREAEAKYRTLVEQIPLVTYVNTLTDTIRTLYISPQVEDLLGYPRDEWLTDDFYPSLLHPDDRERVLAEVARTHASGTPFHEEYRLIAADGREVWVLDETRAVENEAGAPIFLQGFMLDITEHKRAESERRQTEELYRLVVDNSLDCICLVNTEGDIVFASASNLALLGRDPSELAGRTFAELVHPEDLDGVRDHLRALRRGGPTTATVARMRHADGSWVSIEGNATGIHDEDGELTLVLLIGRDVTERKRLEDQLRQAQKMEAVGNLAGGIAHDFNNLLTAISGYSDFIVGDPEAGESVRRSATQIVRASERAAALTRQLLAFSRKQVLQPVALAMNDVVTDVEKMLGRIIGEHIHLETKLDANVSSVRADRGQLEQVLLNLAVNARDAMDAGGTLTIETADVDLDESYTSRHVGLEPGSYSMLAVSDTGHGIDAGTRDRIFEPFFTTKEPGKGTGLGLATVYGIVKQSGGHVAVYSEPGHGATFKVYLPHAAGEGQAAPVPLPSEPLAEGSETILLVEDEPIVREIASEILERAGYEVLSAEEPATALEIASLWEGEIDLLLTDVVMPGMNGHELAQRLTTMRPGIKVLFTSGYTDGAVVHHGVSGEGSSFLQKPFTRKTLTRRVREILDEGSVSERDLARPA
jgi:two-component system cell cycle sensor histidine kinase/response regulator CckA